MPEILRAFLSPDDVASLQTLSTNPGWIAGRQGTGYDKLPLAFAIGHPLVARAVSRIGAPYENYWDVYLIRYLDGAHIPDHLDPAQHGRRHRRINAVLAQPVSGGELRIDDALVELDVGDAVLFEPDHEVHRVSPVVGTRLIFSVGAWI